jgi:hypothetical protein
VKSDRQLLPLAASCLGGAADPTVRQKNKKTATSQKEGGKKKHSDS